MVFHRNYLFNGFSYKLLVFGGSYVMVSLCRLLVCDGFLYRLFLLKLFVSMKRGYVYVW